MYILTFSGMVSFGEMRSDFRSACQPFFFSFMFETAFMNIAFQHSGLLFKDVFASHAACECFSILKYAIERLQRTIPRALELLSGIRHSASENTPDAALKSPASQRANPFFHIEYAAVPSNELGG